MNVSIPCFISYFTKLYDTVLYGIQGDADHIFYVHFFLDFMAIVLDGAGAEVQVLGNVFSGVLAAYEGNDLFFFLGEEDGGAFFTGPGFTEAVEMGNHADGVLAVVGIAPADGLNGLQDFALRGVFQQAGFGAGLVEA